MFSDLRGGAVEVVRLDVFRDGRGALTPVDFMALDFMPVRAFLVAGQDGAVRGGHGHRRGRQLLFRISGAIEVELRHAGGAAQVRLDEERPALMIGAPVWARQTYRGANAALMVFCDTPYDPDAYLSEPVP